MGTQIEARARKMDLVIADLVTEKPPGSAVMFKWNGKTACQIA